MVENHLETLIIKHFDPKKADSIFSAEGEVRKKLAVEYLFDALHGRKIQTSQSITFTTWLCLEYVFQIDYYVFVTGENGIQVVEFTQWMSTEKCDIQFIHLFDWMMFH